MKKYDIATIIFVFILLGTELLALLIMFSMFIYEKYFPKEEVNKDNFNLD